MKKEKKDKMKNKYLSKIIRLEKIPSKSINLWSKN